MASLAQDVFNWFYHHLVGTEPQASSSADSHEVKLDPGVSEKLSAVEAELADFLVRTVTHENASTCELHAKAVDGLKGAPKGAILCKNIFYKCKKKPMRWLVTMKPDRNLDTKAFGSILTAAERLTDPNVSISGGNLRFVAEDEMKSLLGLEQGSVTPLYDKSLDTEKLVHIVLDEDMVADRSTVLGVHPRTCEATTFITAGDLIKYLQSSGHEPRIINFDKVVAEAAKEPAKDGKGGAKQGKKGGKGGKQGKKGKGGKQGKGGDKDDPKKITVTREQDFASWYSQVVAKSEFIHKYDISGCYILRPNAMFCWTEIQAFFDKNIRAMGIQNAYFPMFVTEDRLQAEEDHVEGFTPEVAWVTHAGKTPLKKKIAVRPTSETVMYPAYADWIKSHRNLPLRLNQWSNIVRWEFKDPRPFIRTREFLWQEGHSAFATKEEADKEVLDILDLYARVYEELLAVKVIKGKKTEMEKFPGGDYTTTIETFIPHSGRSVQAATSHGLGQNFGKIFKIKFEDQDKKTSIPYQNSWGLTTRTIGVMIMQHGDDKGLVLPPRVAHTQIVIVPIVIKLTPEQLESLKNLVAELAADLKAKNLRVYVDDRDQYNPGWKFNHWELRGIPLRIEIGPKDLENKQCVLVRRDTGAKETVDVATASDRVPVALEEMQHDMLERSNAMLIEKRRKTTNWSEFLKHLEERCYILAPCCGDKTCEEQIKALTKLAGEESKEDDATFTDDTGEVIQKLTGAAKSLCIPFQQEELEEGQACINGQCELKAKSWTLFGRSY